MPAVFSSHADFKEWFSNPLTGMVEGSQEYNESIIMRLHQVGAGWRGKGEGGRGRREGRKEEGGRKEGEEEEWEEEEVRIYVVACTYYIHMCLCILHHV